MKTYILVVLATWQLSAYSQSGLIGNYFEKPVVLQDVKHNDKSIFPQIKQSIDSVNTKLELFICVYDTGTADLKKQFEKVHYKEGDTLVVYDWDREEESLGSDKMVARIKYSPKDSTLTFYDLQSLSGSNPKTKRKFSERHFKVMSHSATALELMDKDLKEIKRIYYLKVKKKRATKL